MTSEGARDEFARRFDALIRDADLLAKQVVSLLNKARHEGESWSASERLVSAWRTGRNLPSHTNEHEFLWAVRGMTELVRRRAARGHTVGELLDEVAWKNLLTRARATAPKSEPTRGEPLRVTVPEGEPVRVEASQVTVPGGEPARVEPPQATVPGGEPPQSEPPWGGAPLSAGIPATDSQHGTYRRSPGRAAAAAGSEASVPLRAGSEPSVLGGARSEAGVPPRSGSEPTVLDGDRSEAGVPPRSGSEPAVLDGDRSDAGVPPQARSDASVPPRARSDASVPGWARPDAGPQARPDASIPGRPSSDASLSPQAPSDESIPRRPPSDEGLVHLPPRNPRFTGRATSLAAIGETFDSGQSTVAAVHGLGGVGKSQIALEYAHRHRDRYRIVWWVRAGDAVDIVTDLVSLAHSLGLDTERELPEVVNALHARLSARSDWFLVFDNATDPDLLVPYLPGGTGHALITSRQRNWGDIAVPCAVEPMGETEAVSLLRGRADGDHGPELTALAAELGYLPLALGQAAAYVQVHGCSFGRYLDLYRQAEQRVLAVGPRPAGYPHTVATTWLLHFESLPAPAVELLQLLSFLAPDSIPLELLLDGAPDDRLPTALREAWHDALERDLTVGALVASSLLTRLDDRTVRVHRLVQAVTRAALTKKDAAIWSLRAIELVQAAFPEESWRPETWPRASLLADHAQAAGMRVQHHQSKVAYRAVQLLHQAGTYLDAHGLYEEAGEPLRKALELARSTDTHKRLGEASVLVMLGTNLLHRKEYVSAAEALNEALEIYDETLHSVNPLVALPLVQLATVAVVIQDYPGARSRLERALLTTRIVGEHRRGHLSGILADLGGVLVRLGELSAAQRRLEEALAEARKSFGERNGHVAVVLFHLAELAHARCEPTAADALATEAVAILTERYGPEHPLTRQVMDGAAELRT